MTVIFPLSGILKTARRSRTVKNMQIARDDETMVLTASLLVGRPVALMLPRAAAMRLCRELFRQCDVSLGRSALIAHLAALEPEDLRATTMAMVRHAPVRVLADWFGSGVVDEDDAGEQPSES